MRERKKPAGSGNQEGFSTVSAIPLFSRLTVDLHPRAPLALSVPFVLTASPPSHGNRGSLRAHTPLLVPSRYLMVRVKSPITQLPRRVYARARIHANGRVCIVDIKAPDLTALDPAYDSVLCTSTYVRTRMCADIVYLCV